MNITDGRWLKVESKTFTCIAQPSTLQSSPTGTSLTELDLCSIYSQTVTLYSLFLILILLLDKL